MVGDEEAAAHRRDVERPFGEPYIGEDMDAAEIDISELGEGRDLEVKRACGKEGRGQLPEDFFKTYSAMANTQGGVIVLGVEEIAPGKFNVVRISDTSRVLKAPWDGVNNGQRVSSNVLNEDLVRVIDAGDRAIISVNVPRAARTQRPVFLGGNPLKGTYRRNFEGDYQCSNEQVQRMLAEQVEPSADGQLLDGFGMDDVDPATLGALRAQFKSTKGDHPWNDLADVEFLRSLGAWTEIARRSVRASRLPACSCSVGCARSWMRFLTTSSTTRSGPLLALTRAGSTGSRRTVRGQVISSTSTASSSRS